MSIANNLQSLNPFNKSAANSEQVSKSSLSSAKSMPSILSRDIEIEGEINSSGIIEIEGKIKGVVRSNLVVIREEGIVEGRIESDSVNIRGKFGGDMKARNVSIFKKAKVTGNIEYISLSVEDGAYIEGQFKQLSDNKKTAKKSNEASEELVRIKG